jgi:hypothetical protein
VSRAYPPEVPRVSRRTAIGIGGAAAAAAWAAPSVLAVDRVGAAGTGVAPVFSGLVSAVANNGATALGVTFGTGAFTPGDLLVAVLLTRFRSNKDNLLTPDQAGWSNTGTVTSTSPAGGATALRGFAAWRFYDDPSPATSTTFSWTKSFSGEDTRSAVLIVGFSGVDVADPVVATSEGGGVGASVLADPIILGTGDTNTQLLFLGGAFGPGSLGSFDGPPTTTPSVTPDFVDTAPETEAPQLDEPEAYMATRVPSVPGSTGTASVPISGYDQNDWVSFQVGLRAAGS